MTRAFTIAGFEVFAVLFVSLIIVSRVRPEKIAPFGALLDRVMVSRPARIAIVLFWWWAGWHFLVSDVVGN